MRKWIAIALTVLIAALAGASIHFRPDRAIRVATNYVAHNICSKAIAPSSNVSRAPEPANGSRGVWANLARRIVVMLPPQPRK